MTLTRFVPYRSSGLSDMDALQSRLNSIFNELGNGLGNTNGSETLGMGNFVPPVDVYEDAQKLALKLEVPGIHKEDLDIHVEGRNLVIKGERKFESEEKEENYHRIERRYGTFVRSFTLPSTVDTDSIDATCADGVLTITLAKKAEAKPKQIPVKTGSSYQGPKQVEASTGQAAKAA